MKKTKKFILFSLLAATVITAGVIVFKKNGNGTSIPKEEKDLGERICENCTG